MIPELTQAQKFRIEYRQRHTRKQAIKPIRRLLRIHGSTVSWIVGSIIVGWLIACTFQPAN